MEIKHSVNLVLGDWSNDGHGRTSQSTIKSNLDNEAIMAAYNEGTKKLGFDFINDCCAEYGESSISKEKLDILVSHGLIMNDIQWESNFNDNDSFIPVWRDSYTGIFLFIVQLGNQNFEYEFSDSTDIHIGGYGLFGG